MQAIKPGDVYFLKSPIKMAEPAHEKKLAYLLGTVSARPVVVIRPPMWWDDYSTVTVLPAITEAKHAITYNMVDRYGMISESDYPVTPHTPHSIPVYRLSRYIGSLDPQEFESLMYAFKWIHDPQMQKTEQIPECYKSVMNPSTIIPKARNRAPRIAPILFVDENNVIHIKGREGLLMDMDTPIEGLPDAINSTDDYKLVEADTPEAIKKAVEPDSNVVVGMNRFPKSIFSEDDLIEVANRFDIDANFYDGAECPIIKKDIKALSDDELDVIMTGLTPPKMQEVIDLYNSMYSIDANLFGPHLPTSVLCRLCKLPVNSAIALKKLCSVLRDMPVADYESRMKAPKASRQETENTSAKTNENSVKSAVMTLHMERDQRKIQEMIARLRPYLTSKTMGTLPRERYADFLRCPLYAIKRAYTGKGFQTVYTMQYAKVKSELNAEVI